MGRLSKGEREGGGGGDIYIATTHDAYENTWKCGELKLYFSPSAGGWKKKKNYYFNKSR